MILYNILKVNLFQVIGCFYKKHNNSEQTQLSLKIQLSILLYKNLISPNCLLQPNSKINLNIQLNPIIQSATLDNLFMPFSSQFYQIDCRLYWISQQKLIMKLRPVRIELSVHKICLKVEFPCRLTFGLKIGRQESHSHEQIKLEDTRAVFSQKLFLNTELAYDPETDTYNQKKGTITVSILSSAIGKNIAGVCNFQWVQALEQHIPLSIKKGFQRCPDKKASIEFTLKATLIGQQIIREFSPDGPKTQRTLNYIIDKHSRYNNESKSVHKKSNTFWSDNRLQLKDSPASHRIINNTTYTPITSRGEHTIRKSEDQAHKYQTFKFQLLQKDRCIKRLQTQNQNFKFETMSLRTQIQMQRSRSRTRGSSTNRENQRLKNRCETLEQTIQELKEFRQKFQKESLPKQTQVESYLYQQQCVKNKYLQEQVNYYKKSKQSVEQALKDHIKQCKFQTTQLNDLKQQISLLEQKLQNKQSFLKEDNKKFSQKINQLEREKYQFALEIEHLKSQLEDKERRVNSASVQKNKFISNQKKKLLKKNQELRQELELLTKFKDRYSFEIQDFILKIQNLKTENNSLQNQLFHSKQQLKKMKSSFEDMTAHKNQNEILIKSKHQQIFVLTQKINFLQIQISSLKNQNDSYQKELQDKKQIELQISYKLDELSKNYRHLQIAHRVLQEQNKHLKSKQEMTTNVQEMKFVQMQQIMFKNKMLQNEIKVLNSEKQQHILKFKDQTQNYHQQVEALKQKIKKLHQQNQLMIGNNKGMEEKNKEFLNKIKEIERNQQDKINKIEKANQILKSQILQKQQTLIELEGKISALQNLNRVKSRQVQFMTEQKYATQRRLTSLQQKIKTQQEDLFTKQSELLKSQKIIKKKDDQLLELQIRISQLQSNIYSETHELNKIRHQTKISHQERAYQKQIIDNLRSQNIELKTNNLKLQNTITQYEVKDKQSAREIENLILDKTKISKLLETKIQQLAQYKKIFVKNLEQFGLQILKNSFVTNRGIGSAEIQINEVFARITENFRKVQEANNHNILELQKKNSTLEDQIQTIKKQFLDKSFQTSTMKQQLMRFHVNENSNQNKILQLKTLISQLNDKISYFEDQKKQIEQDKFHLILEKEKIEMQLKLKNAGIVDKQKQISLLSSSLESLRSSYDAVVQHMSQANSQYKSAHEFTILKQSLRRKQSQQYLLTESIQKLRLERDNHLKAKYELMVQVNEQKQKIQFLKNKEIQLEHKLKCVEDSNLENKLNYDYIQAKNKQLQEELRESQEKRFHLIKENQNIVLQLSYAKKEKQYFKENSLKETSEMLVQINELRKQRKELDNKHLIVKKQSLKRQKQLEYKENQINRLIKELQQKQKTIEIKIRQFNQKQNSKNQKTFEGSSFQFQPQLTQQKRHLQNDIATLNQQISRMRIKLLQEKKQHQVSEKHIQKLHSQLSSNKQMLLKALSDLNVKQEQISCISKNNLKYFSKQLNEKQDVILMLKMKIQSIERQKSLQQSRLYNTIKELESTIEALNKKVKNYQNKEAQQNSINYLDIIQQLQGKIRNLTKQNEGLQSAYDLQRSENRNTQDQGLKRFQKHLNDILTEKQNIKQQFEEMKIISSSTKTKLEKKCTHLQKQLNEANNIIKQLRNTPSAQTEGATYFMKSINQYQKVSKQAIDKFRDIQRSMDLTQAEKVKIINKIREFALLLLRCKTKNLERGSGIQETRLIVDQYKLLQQKINQLVQYSFAVFEVQIPQQFQHQIKNSMQEYAEQIAVQKVHGESVLNTSLLQKFKRFHRSLSVIDPKSK